MKEKRLFDEKFTILDGASEDSYELGLVSDGAKFLMREMGSTVEAYSYAGNCVTANIIINGIAHFLLDGYQSKEIALGITDDIRQVIQEHSMKTKRIYS